MSKGLATCGAILALAILAILYFMPMPQPYTDALALSQGLREIGVGWWSDVSQAYNKDFLADLRLGTTLWGYRAIDVLIQAFLILGAACGVTALFRIEPPKEVIEEEEAVIEASIEEVIEEEEV
ncbi:MAG: hypothetical protein QXQ03_03810 [Candidatus Nezhaarchaeales archaeon]